MSKYDFKRVNVESRKRALDIILHIFPGISNQNGLVYLSSPIKRGGRSCIVTVEGDGSGTWIDYGASQHPRMGEIMSHGDMIDLVRFNFDFSYSDACAYIGDLLDLPQSYVAVNLDSLTFAPSLTAGLSYFYDTGINDTTLRMCNDSLTLAMTNESQFIAFTHQHPSGEVYAAHLLYPRKTEQDDNSWLWYGKPTYPWRMQQALMGNRDLLVITEGEKDAMTCLQLGYNAVSIPSGASNTRWIDYTIELLDNFKEVCLVFDNDQAGVSGTRKTFFALAAENIPTSFITWTRDEKDVSDLLKAGKDNEIHTMLQNRTKISLDFSVITLTDKRDDAIVTIDNHDFTVKELKRLLQEK